MNKARNTILSRLRENRHTQTQSVDIYSPHYGWQQSEKIKRLSDNMTAVRTEVIDLQDDHWIDWINRELPARGLNRVLIGDTAEGHSLSGNATDQLNIQIYDKNIEQWKEELFTGVDVGITSTFGGIAESGSLILWPDDTEPRLMSLVPPVHIALLQVETIHETFAEAITAQNWALNMPTNALLISGPSKTADIEQTLAYGIHGPQQLIVLLIKS